MRHSKKITLTAIIAMLGSALVASPAHAATPPVVVDCSDGGTFTYTHKATKDTSTYPGGVKVEVTTASADCKGVATIPSSVNSIGYRAFFGTTALETITFEDGSLLPSIGTEAFYGAFGLKSIIIPRSVVKISVDALAYAKKLESVTFEGNAPTVERDPGGTEDLHLAFLGTKAGSVANIGPQATGFGDGPTWQGLTLTRAGAPADETVAPAPYTGPLLANYSDRTPEVGDEVVVSGLRLSSITSCSIDGVTAALSNQSADSFTIAIPAGLEPGLKDLVITSSAGTLTVQDAVTVSAAAEDASESSSGVSAKGWTKKLTDSSVKIYAKDLVGAGKVQFLFNGKEIAWVNATTESDRKLRTANGAHYMVRTVELVKGQKNILEVHVDGIRIKRAAYGY